MKLRRLLCITLALVTLLCTLPIMSAGATDASSTVSFCSPAITADAGQTVKLSSYAVEFTSGTVTAADKISWSSADITVNDASVTPSAAGVYKLTATAGSSSKTVYLVVKNASDSEYVLYYNDFSDTSLEGWRAVQQSSGAVYSASNGKLVLNASNGDDSYIRLLLPEWLGEFGDYDITTSFTITKTTAKSRWLSVMARVQKNNYPYWQAAVRQNAKASNGTEIAERTSANKWNVTHTASYSEDISASKYYEFSFSLRGNIAATAINGTRLLYSNSMTYTTGDVGLQVRGMSASFDYIKVAISAGEINGTSHSMNEVREPESNIILTPAMASYVDSATTLADIQKNSPAVAVLYINSSLDVTDADGAKISTLDDALAKLNKTVIPAFYIKDKATLTALAAYLKSNKLTDLYFMSSDSSLMNTARTTYTSSFGILDCTERTIASRSDLLALRSEANTCRAKVILLPEDAITYDNVQYLQKMLMTVWAKPTDSTVGYLGAITAGVNGIVASDRATLENMFTEYFAANTMIRPVSVIGHRGVPSLAQENTIAGSVLAYEKGATMIEMDIYLSKDNTLVVMHDSTIDRTTNGTGNTESFTVAELQQYVVDSNTSVASQPIPTLEDYFKEFKGKDVQLVVEIKSGASTKIEAALKTLIEQYDIADQINVITFSETHMNNMRASLPGISVGYLTSAIALNETEPLVSLENILEKIQPLSTTFNPSYASATLGPNLIREASYRGITLWPYTINNSDDFNNYILYGTNGITTNYSQYVTNYVKRITAPADEITVTADGVDFALTRTTYGRATNSINNAELVVVEDGGLNVSYADGKLSATGNGTATVYFRLAVRMATGKTYYVCSEPVTVNCGTVAETTTPADTPTTAPTESEVTTAPTESSNTTVGNETTATQNNGGCTGFVTFGMMACIIPAAVVILKKKKQ